jgi:hypothetical protein
MRKAQDFSHEFIFPGRIIRWVFVPPWRAEPPSTIDWKRYKADENYRKRFDEQQRLAREMETQHQSYQRERNRDEPDR